MSDLENKSSAMVGVEEHGLKQHDVKVSTVVFMIFCLCAAGAYGIEEMIPESGPGLTIIMLIVLPFVWSTPLGLVAAELGSARPQEGGYYKWVQEALGEYWGFQAGWWRTISIYIDNTLYVILAGGIYCEHVGHRTRCGDGNKDRDDPDFYLYQHKRCEGRWNRKYHTFHPGNSGVCYGRHMWFPELGTEPYGTYNRRRCVGHHGIQRNSLCGLGILHRYGHSPGYVDVCRI